MNRCRMLQNRQSIANTGLRRSQDIPIALATTLITNHSIWYFRKKNRRGKYDYGINTMNYAKYRWRTKGDKKN